MSIGEIKEAVQQLTSEEMDELTLWLNEQRTLAEKAEADWSAWDKQLEDDVQEGRLDSLIAEARADIKAERVRPLP